MLYDELPSKLENISQFLRTTSLVVVASTMGNVLIILISAMRLIGQSLHSGLLDSTDIIIFSASFAFMAICFAVIFDLLKRRGESIYDTLTDEFHADSDPYGPDSLRIKWLLKDFTNSSELPLVRGQSGPVLILLINIIIVVLVFYILSFSLKI